MRKAPDHRRDYVEFMELQTRWSDNDVFGHINNMVYYSLFDTAISSWLVNNGILNLHKDRQVSVIAQNGCTYFSEVAFPDKLTAGLRICHIGHSSVRYELGLFRNEEENASAEGHFVHVYLNALTRKPEVIGEPLRVVLSRLLRPEAVGMEE
ncbi:thioesterase family protein [uncultured Cohaesibacter sp.]|uniref:acyl-CoA thioesterase n=1 Tax=uncultured Cohaesibacter sp. TaxID=1002546 RepID=UPI002931ED54|nr:thioesterase family protein [uncultured Cohaesibacter sp.]